MNPRDAILPADRSTPVDYAYAWAGIYHRPGWSTGGCCTSPTAWDGRGPALDLELHREAESFATVGLLGVFYRRGVASSLTQIEGTCVSSTSFARSTRWWRKPRRTATPKNSSPRPCAPIRDYFHHLGSIERFEPAVARKLKSMSAVALRNMPQDVLDDALDSMDVQRATRLRRLRRRPASTTGVAA